MDIKHVVNATAVITLGKDMVFRDFVQGAYRMRGIGAGQRVRVFVIPEVRQLMRRELSTCGCGESVWNADGTAFDTDDAAAGTQLSAAAATNAAAETVHKTAHEHLLEDVVAWLRNNCGLCVGWKQRRCSSAAAIDCCFFTCCRRRRYCSRSTQPYGQHHHI